MFTKLTYRPDPWDHPIVDVPEPTEDVGELYDSLITEKFKKK